MNTLYIITGPAGVGKTTISKGLAKRCKKSALIEGDDIYHQVVGGYVQAWKSGNHLKTFWKICINTIKIYLDDGFDVVFNYIVTPENIQLIKSSIQNYRQLIKHIFYQHRAKQDNQRSHKRKRHLPGLRKHKPAARALEHHKDGVHLQYPMKQGDREQAAYNSQHKSHHHRIAREDLHLSTHAPRFQPMDGKLIQHVCRKKEAAEQGYSHCTTPRQCHLKHQRRKFPADKHADELGQSAKTYQRVNKPCLDVVRSSTLPYLVPCLARSRQEGPYLMK